MHFDIIESKTFLPGISIADNFKEGRYFGVPVLKRVGMCNNPDDLVYKYGVDTFRKIEMFLGPVEMSIP